MTVSILDGDALLDKKELDFFLKGNTSLEDADEPSPGSWISVGGWKDLQTLITINESLKNFITDLKDNLKLFKTWYDDERPESIDLPL